MFFNKKSTSEELTVETKEERKKRLRKEGILKMANCCAVCKYFSFSVLDCGFCEALCINVDFIDTCKHFVKKG